MSRPGSYRLHVFHERAAEQTLAALTRTIEVADGAARSLRHCRSRKTATSNCRTKTNLGRTIRRRPMRRHIRGQALKFSRLSLLWKILIPTSLVMTLAFAITGWLVQRDVVRASYASVEQEAKASFQAYESLWKARANRLGAGERNPEHHVRRPRRVRHRRCGHHPRHGQRVMVQSFRGRRILSGSRRAGPRGGKPGPTRLLRTERRSSHGPRGARPVSQAGFGLRTKGRRIVSGSGHAGLRAVVRGPGAAERAGGRLPRGRSVAERLKNSTGGSEYVFVSRNRVVTSTLSPAITAAIAPRLLKNSADIPDYVVLPTPLRDLNGAEVGQLFILRSLAGARQRLAGLRRDIVALWLLALVAALLITYLVARKIMQPVAELDRAAAEIAKQNYDYQINVRSQDELGRLAGTFQSMCESIRQARDELIRQERIATIGQLSTSIVHDLRNPLAAIYAGAEMMMDSDLPQDMTRRLARNIYRASRGIQDMLQQLLDVVRGKSSGSELCSVREVISAAWSTVAPSADALGIRLDVEVPDDLECPMERARMERVFANLFENAIEAMRSGGCISIQGDAGRRQHHGSRGGQRARYQRLTARTIVPAVCNGRQEERSGPRPGSVSPNAARSRRRHLGRRRTRAPDRAARYFGCDCRRTARALHTRRLW